MHVESVSWGAELTVLDVGYAFEMLRFWAHFLWLGADAETPFPGWLEGRAGTVLLGLAALAERGLSAEAKQALAAAERDFKAAWTDYKTKWLGEEHRARIRFLQDSEPECIPEDWAQENSPLTWQCWTAASASLRQAASQLPEPLPACFSVGVLCARVEGLPLGSATQDAIPGELYPLTAAQHALLQLKTGCRLLADLDVDLGHSLGTVGSDFREVKSRCSQVHGAIRHRFLAGVAAGEDRHDRVAVDQAEAIAHADMAVKSASLAPGSRKKGFKPPELAKQWGVSPDKVRAWILSGELEAIDISKTQGGRPRYLIPQAAIEAFEACRSIQTPPEPSPRRTRQAGDEDVIEFF